MKKQRFKMHEMEESTTPVNYIQREQIGAPLPIFLGFTGF
jgi:hypothetical protein